MATKCRFESDLRHAFRFRTPSLRNIALSSPYGHAGAFNSLKAVVKHHQDSIDSLLNYDQQQAVLPSRVDLDAHDFIVMNNEERCNAIAAANELQPAPLSEKEIDSLLAFLHALTDPAALDMKSDVPSRLPSGLRLAE